MEGLSQILQPHKVLIGNIASVVTIAQFFSGGFLCKDIYHVGSTEGTNCFPFIGGITIGVLMLKYAAILQDPAMFQVNIAAVLLNVLYLIFYSFYAKSKSEIVKPLSLSVALIAIMFGYVEFETPELVEYRYGLIVTIFMLTLIGSPLLEVGEVIKKKDSSCIPFPLVFSGAIVSILWFIYGIILLNYFMIVQNIIGLGLCVVQLMLCYMYPKPIKVKKNKKE